MLYAHILSPLARSRYFSSFSLFFNFAQWSDGTAKSVSRLFFIVYYNKIWSSGLDWAIHFYSPSPPEYFACLISPGEILVCVYIIWQGGKKSVVCTTLSGLPIPPSRAYSAFTSIYISSLSLSLSLSHSLSLIYSLSLTYSHSFSLTHSLTLRLTHSLSLSLIHSLSLTLTYSFSLSYTPTHSLSHSLSVSLIHSLSHSHSLSFSLTHSQSLSLSLSIILTHSSLTLSLTHSQSYTFTLSLIHSPSLTHIHSLST